VTEFHLGLSLEEATSAVQSIARIHASVLAYRLRLGVDLGQAFPFLFRPEAAAESYQQLLERGLPQLATFLHTADRPELHAVLAKLHKMRPRARETIANLLRPASPIATLTHTDFWCNNLLFRHKTAEGATADVGDGAAGVECSILDWQMATYSRPTNDLALLLVTSVAGDVRRTRTGHILDAYWNQFCQTAASLGLDVEGQLNYGRRELETEYEQSLLLAVLLGIGSVDLAIGHQATEERLCEVLVDLSNEKVF
jgi:thiamine kinase-like enzyme